MLVPPARISMCSKHTRIELLRCLALWHPNKSLSMGSPQAETCIFHRGCQSSWVGNIRMIIHPNKTFRYFIRCFAGISAVIRLYN